MVVSQTANASKGLIKHNVAVKEVCSILFGNASEQIQYFDEPRQCSIFSPDKRND